MFKKLLLGLGIAGLLGLGSMTLVNAAGSAGSVEFKVGDGFNAGDGGGLNVMGKGQDQGGNLINVIKTFLNRVLGLLSLVALVLLLWGGFKMLTAAGDEGKFKEGFKVLKQAGIGLAVIGLSWFIVSIVFRLVQGSAGESSGGGVGM